MVLQNHIGILALLVLLLTLGCVASNNPQAPTFSSQDATPPPLSSDNGMNNPPTSEPQSDAPFTEPPPPIEKPTPPASIVPLNQRLTPEIPSGSELSNLPECEQTFFSKMPVNLAEVYEITPLGSLNPPDHTFPTEHTFFHLSAGNESTELFPLFAPADVYITSISGGSGLTQDPFDYTIYFALCRNVIGYYNHVKELSEELKAIKENGRCNKNPGNDTYEYCENGLDIIKAGAIMGKVGRLQGNFDFGLIDLSKKNDFANPERYGFRSLHVQCPFTYYEESMQKPFFDLIERNDDQPCGVVMQDIPGTLQGNWFQGNASASSGSDWGKYLAFAHNNTDPAKQIVSIGGVFTSPGKWEFTPQKNGNVNRDFSEVTPGNTICYESSNQQGKIIVHLASETELKIEKQTGNCSGTNTFQNPTTYNR